MSTISEVPPNYPPEIIGYAEPWIVGAGDEIHVKVSSTEPQYTYRTIRLIQGHVGEGAPPEQEEQIADIPQGAREGRFQRARPGSYGEVADLGFQSDDNGCEIDFYIEPHLPEVGQVQALVALSDETGENAIAIVLDEIGQLSIRLEVDGQPILYPVDFRPAEKRWLHVVTKIEDSKVRISLSSVSLYAQKSSSPVECDVAVKRMPDMDKLTILTIAGRRCTDGKASRIVDFFDGRLDDVILRTLGRRSRLLIAYDFSLDMSSNKIIDISGSGRHGFLYNAPTRAVRGHNWDGSEVDWTKSSFGYGAIHFHSDDLSDASFATDFSITIPPHARSGAYAVEVRSASNPDIYDKITFFVRPNAKSTARVALVLSTFTYLAYANEHMWDQSRSSRLEVPSTNFEIREDEDLRKMRRRNDLGLSLYDVHRDGSGMVYSTSKRPILNVRPGYVHWAFQRPREFSADLLMIGFLEHLGIDYDVVYDHDMHDRGVSAVARYNTIITGCHPEYHSIQTLDAWTHFAQRGGNIMYLGGNGFYWVANPNPQDPHLLEVRRGDQGVRTFMLPGGERHHSSNGTQGGLWRSRGRPANVLFGVGCCGEGLGPGVPYKRAVGPGSPYCWVFEGIAENELLGKDGFGGGASGDEIDCFDVENGSPKDVVILARSIGHSDDFGLFPEECGFPMVNTLGTQTDRIRSDMTIYQTSGGGHVFSVGSINWYSSLGWNIYRSNVATLTANVLRYFSKD